MKAIRQQFWFITSFLKKYSSQISLGAILTIASAILGNLIISRLPKTKPIYRIGLVGQYTTSKLPHTILNLIGGGLTTINANHEVIPNLAQSWSVDEAGNTYTFILKPDLKWSDDQPVELKDIKITIPSVTVETQDPRSIIFKLPSKFSPFPSLLNFPLVSSKGKIIGEYDIRIKQRGAGLVSQIILDSKTRKIVFNFYSTANQAITAYKLGQVDLVERVSAQADTLASYGKVGKNTDTSQVVLVIFNQSDPNLKDKAVRQGIAYSLKDKSFRETPALTTINPQSWGYNPLVKTYPFNPQRTRELIKTPLTLELSTLP